MLISQQIAYYLTYQGIANYTELDTEGNVFIDILPEGENRTGIYNRTGNKSDTKLGYQLAGVQIIYRGTQNPIESFTKAQEIYFALHGFSGFFVSNESLEWGITEMAWLVGDVPLDGYPDGGENWIVSCLSNQGGAERIGISENGEYEYSINLVVDYKK
jgi:hypothetical protein